MDTFPYFIADGAEALVSLYEKGLRSMNTRPIMEEIEEVAVMLDVAQCLCLRRVSPKLAATLMIDDMERRGLAVCPRSQQDIVIAELEGILIRLTTPATDA